MNTSEPVLLGISASPRAKFSTPDYLDALRRFVDYEQMQEVIYELASSKKVSNAEGLLLASLCGAKSDNENIKFDALNLRDVFQSGKVSQKELAERISRSRGIIISTPVYFGDRSSWLDMLVEFIRDSRINVEDKIMGSLSVGAKRNGGQETTLIFGLLDALNLGFDVVGNGSPSCQFGGTGWAGDMGKIQDDKFGIETSFGVGKRLARYFQIQSLEPAPVSQLTIGIVHSGFKPNHKEIKDMASYIESKGAKVVILGVDELKVSPCRGCSTCPTQKGLDYGCAVKDDMQKFRELSSEVDGMLLMVSRGSRNSGRYQTFLERTRFMRRDDFVLSDIPFAAYSREENFIGTQYATRMLVAFLRHNMYILSPLLQIISDDKHTVQNASPKQLCTRLVDFAAKSKTARTKHYVKYIYEAIGYAKKT